MDSVRRIRNEIAERVSEAIGIGPEEAAAALEFPPGNIDADLSFPCFFLSRKEKRNPAEIAKELASGVRPWGYVKSVENSGAYVNFVFAWEKLGGKLIEEAIKEGKRFGSGEEKGKVMVEFAQPNTHKAFHIGHVRNICIGESLSRLLEFSGKSVVRANYQGDIGPHVAKCIWGFLNIYKGKAPDGNRGAWLGKVYAEANRMAEQNERIKEEIRDINKRLYSGDRKLMKVLRETRKWSLEYFDSIYRDFGVKFDRLYFESEVEARGREIANELLDRGVAKESDGAVVIDLEKHGLGVYVLVTGDGTPLYSVKDIALAELQEREYHPDRIIHVVGEEQTLHFRQLFKSLEMINPEVAAKEYHLPYGLVRLPSGKVSSRKGTVVTYDEMKERVMEKAREECRKRGSDAGAAKSIAMAAIRYDMMKTSPEKSIMFDWDRALSMEGNTGPYLQYTYARASSILRKCGENGGACGSFEWTESERKLLRTMGRLGFVVEAGAKDYRPHYIANYAYELATSFNEFYEKVPVIKTEGETRKVRVSLVKAFRQVLGNCLWILGIEALERM